LFLVVALAAVPGDCKSLQQLRSRPSATEFQPAKAGFANVAAISIAEWIELGSFENLICTVKKVY